MTDSTSATWQEKLQQQLREQRPFSFLSDTELTQWIGGSKRVRYEPGDRLLRPDEFFAGILLILEGDVRMISSGDEQEGLFTLEKRGPGQLVGWVSLLRGEPTEFIQASTNVIALKLAGKDFISFVQNNADFANHFFRLTNSQEAYSIASAALELKPKHEADWQKGLIQQARRGKTFSIKANESLETLPELPSDWAWHMSTPEVPGIPVGTQSR